jgi:hypothetical protein
MVVDRLSWRSAHKIVLAAIAFPGLIVLLGVFVNLDRLRLSALQILTVWFRVTSMVRIRPSSSSS